MMIHRTTTTTLGVESVVLRIHELQLGRVPEGVLRQHAIMVSCQHLSSSMAMARIQPPLAPLIFTGKQKKVNPKGGS